MMCINSVIDTHHMRTNITIDDDLMAVAMQATGVKSKKETVELFIYMGNNSILPNLVRLMISQIIIGNTTPMQKLNIALTY